ncbi:MAG: hypothetical protein VKK97_12485 [Synechococcaceae cyanobacterium]|nr:hypothetical protein [Synechococcaceae cyanobacterium]
MQYLGSAVGQTLLARVSLVTTVAFVPMGEIKTLPIVIPSTAEFKRAEEPQEKSVGLSRELENLSSRLAELSRMSVLCVNRDARSGSIWSRPGLPIIVAG